MNGFGIRFAAVLLSGMLVCACVGSPQAHTGEENEPQTLEENELPQARARPGAQNRTELTVVFTTSEVELDFRKSFLVNEAELFTALYEGLFSYHPYTMEPVRALAESWKVSEDKKQWTFTIRENARYWNGDPVKAGDFQAAWLSLLSPNRDSPYSSLFDIIEGARDFRLGKLRDKTKVGVSAVDDRTLVVRLNSPASFFPSMLCHHSFSPVHPSMLDKEDWSAAPPISNGPFYVTQNSKGILTLEKNAHYWDASQVALSKLTFRLVDDEEDAAALWNSGEARWISGGLNFDALTDRSGIVVNTMFATHYYFIRSVNKPWQDNRLRRALSLALPWDKLREGHYQPAKTLIYPLSGYPKLEGLETTDLQEARRLLTEAGYPGGKGLPELKIRLSPSEEAARVGGIMAAAWIQELGLSVKIDVVPYGNYFQALKRNDYDVGFSTWIGDFADPYTFLQMWRRDSNLNDARYSDDEFEALLDKSMTEEGQKRWETLAQAEKILLDRGTVLPISYSPAFNIIDTEELDGWFPNALDIHPLKYLSYKQLQPLPGVVLLSPFWYNKG